AAPWTFFIGRVFVGPIKSGNKFVREGILRRTRGFGAAVGGLGGSRPCLQRRTLEACCIRTRVGSFKRKPWSGSRRRDAFERADAGDPRRGIQRVERRRQICPLPPGRRNHRPRG